MKLEMIIDKPDLERHVKRICRGNLKKPAKICRECPFLVFVVDIMREHGWKYNEKEIDPLYRKARRRLSVLKKQEVGDYCKNC